MGVFERIVFVEKRVSMVRKNARSGFHEIFDKVITSGSESRKDRGEARWLIKRVESVRGKIEIG